MDRGIIIELERITKDKIRKVEEIWQEFEKIKHQLLGYIFDILVKVLQVKRSGGIEIKEGLPRMADFAELGETCTPVSWESGLETKILCAFLTVTE